jgi:hypothetical protein
MHALLAVLANPVQAQAHLEALEQAHAKNLASTADLAAERDRNQKALETVADLRQREEAVAAPWGDFSVARILTATVIAIASRSNSSAPAALSNLAAHRCDGRALRTCCTSSAPGMMAPALRPDNRQH